MNKTYRLSHRNGISIIEVLTSIVVAMIGVFGIMILIPFSVKQAKTGLDLDGATVLARNAMARWEVQGYRNPGNWLSAAATAVDPTVPQMFSIDPLAVTENGGDYTTTAFPYNVDGAVYPANYLIAPASLATPAGVDMVVADARRMFRGLDELVFADAPDELEGPSQIFDFGAAGIPLRRQNVGSLSWSLLAMPFKPAGVTSGVAWKYRVNVLVYKDRSTDVAAVQDNQMHVAHVDHLATPSTPIGPASPVGTIFLEANPIPLEYGINKGDWVMLINRAKNVVDDAPVAGLVFAEKGFEYQVGFFRIVNFNLDATGTSLATVTLDGPDFDFGGDPTDPDTLWDQQGTYLVHLRNVVSVYERTIAPESESTWNISF